MLPVPFTPSCAKVSFMPVTTSVSPSRSTLSVVMVWPPAAEKACQSSQTCSGVTSAKAGAARERASAVLPASLRMDIMNLV